MKKRFIYNVLRASALSLFVLSCKTGVDQKKLQGAWRFDSLYDYYNGFSYMNRNPQPAEVHVYNGVNTMLRRGMGHEKTYYYQIEEKQIVISDSLGSSGARHLVLKLDSNQLVLKKENRPLFPGENQVKYEIRFFTRIPSYDLK